MSPGDFEGRVPMQSRHHLGAFVLHPSLVKEVMERHAVGCDVTAEWRRVSLPWIFTWEGGAFQPSAHLFVPERLPPQDTQ